MLTHQVYFMLVCLFVYCKETPKRGVTDGAGQDVAMVATENAK